MKVKFINARDNGTKIYGLIGTTKEIADHKAAVEKRNQKYILDKSTGMPLYFTSRPLSSESEYTLDKDGYLEDKNAISKSQEVLDTLAMFKGMSVTDLQKFAQIKQAGY